MHDDNSTALKSQPEAGPVVDDFVALRIGEVRWRVRPSVRELILGDHAPNWFALSGDSRATLAKRGFRREIWSTKVQGSCVFAKVVRYNERAFLDRIRFTLGRTASHREFHHSVGAESRGAPVVRVIAFGERLEDPRATVLITEGVKNAKTLIEAWRDALDDPNPQDRSRSLRALEYDLAKLFACAHRSGFVHLDGHPGNILVSDNAGEMKFVDATLAQVHVGHPPWTQIIGSLAQLDHYMKRVASRSQRLRFLRAYIEELKAPRSFRHEIWIEHTIVPATLALERIHAARLARQRDRRLTRSGSYFTSMRFAAGWSGRVVLKLERRHVFPEPKTADFSRKRWTELLGSLRGDDSAMTATAGSVSRDGFVLERFAANGFLQGVFWRLFGSPAWRSFRRCHELRHRDLRAPLALACLEKRIGLATSHCAIIVAPDAQESDAPKPAPIAANGSGPETVCDEH